MVTMGFDLQPGSWAAQPDQLLQPPPQKREREQAEKTWQTGGTKESNVSNQSSKMKGVGNGILPTSGYFYNSWQRLNIIMQPTLLSTTVSSEAHIPPSQLANKEISNSFWNDPKITLKQQINVSKYRMGTVYTQKHAIRIKKSNTSTCCPLCGEMDSINHIALR
eukprot:1141288-Pelagomonas_calceolata.AAC.1